VAAGGVRDGGKHEVQGGAVESGQAVTEVDRGVGGADRRGDPQEPLFPTGQAADLLGDGGEVDPVPVHGVLHPRPPRFHESAVQRADQQLGRRFQRVLPTCPGPELFVCLVFRCCLDQDPDRAETVFSVGCSMRIGRSGG
jgi:hypothetical protein